MHPDVTFIIDEEAAYSLTQRDYYRHVLGNDANCLLPNALLEGSDKAVRDMLIAGDIGGTKSHLVAYDEADGKFRWLPASVMLLANFPASKNWSRNFLARLRVRKRRQSLPPGLVFPVPSWTVVFMPHISPGSSIPASLAVSLGLPREHIVLMNDLVATARGLRNSKRQTFCYLNRGVDHPEENVAVIAAGTGLGEAVLYWDGQAIALLLPKAAPRISRPAPIAKSHSSHFSSERLSRVSCEELFSGRGFRPIHEFLAPDVRHESFGKPPANRRRKLPEAR